MVGLLEMAAQPVGLPAGEEGLGCQGTRGGRQALPLGLYSLLISQ